MFIILLITLQVSLASGKDFSTDLGLLKHFVKELELTLGTDDQCAIVVINNSTVGAMTPEMFESLSELELPIYHFNFDFVLDYFFKNQYSHGLVSVLHSQLSCAIAVTNIDVFVHYKGRMALADLTQGVANSITLIYPFDAEISGLGHLDSNVARLRKDIGNKVILDYHCLNYEKLWISSKIGFYNSSNISKLTLTDIHPHELCPNPMAGKILTVSTNYYRHMKLRTAADKLRLVLNASWYRGTDADFVESSGLDIQYFRDYPNVRNLMAMDFFSAFPAMEFKWMSAKQSRRLNFWNFVTPLPSMAWLVILLSAILFTLCFLLFKRVYLSLPVDDRLHQPFVQSGFSDSHIILRTISTLTEPDPLPYFPRWSAGRISLLLWSIFVLFINMFYNSNLLANILYPNWVKPIDSDQDVADMASVAFFETYEKYNPEEWDWRLDNFLQFMYGYCLPDNPCSQELLDKIKIMPVNLGSGAPPEFDTVLSEENAVYLLPNKNLRLSKELEFYFSQFRASKENAFSIMSLPSYPMARKYSYWYGPLHNQLLLLDSMGLDFEVRVPPAFSVTNTLDAGIHLIPLSFSLLAFPFSFLCLGLVVSMLGFLVEFLQR